MKMSGAVLHGARDLRVETCPVPKLARGQVRVRVRLAGICGSDIHYFRHGHCAAFVPTRPFILGHELVGEVTDVAEDVDSPSPGARVAVNPARACGKCDYCRKGRRNLCPRTVMLGSASTNPPTDGAFAQFVVVSAAQCHVLPQQMSDSAAAMIEPLAVALHAVKQAGDVSGKSVLVMGAGPIGLLTAMTARTFGAKPVVMSDIMSARREQALHLGIDEVLNPAQSTAVEHAQAIAGGGFEVVFEASGAAAALRQAFHLVRPGAAIVQIGTLGTDDIPLPANQVMSRELRLVGSFRYGDDFDEAVQLAIARRLGLPRLVTNTFPLQAVSDAMRLACSTANALKIQIAIE